MTAPPTLTSAQPGQWISKTAHGMPYSLLPPAGLDPSYSYPILLVLHQFQDEGEQPQQWDPWVNTSWFRAAHPCFVFAPKCTINGRSSSDDFNWGGVTDGMQPAMKVAMQILDEEIAANPIDTARQLVTGNSMGGLGTEGLMCNPSLYGRFAAFMPVDGACYYNLGNAAVLAARLKDVPIWICHGTQDTSVSPQFDQKFAAAMQAARASNFQFTQPNVGHGSWGNFYPQRTPWDWLFKQRLGGMASPNPTPVPVSPATALADANAALVSAEARLNTVLNLLGA